MFPAPILVSGFTSCRFTQTRNVLSLFTAIATATLSLFAHVTRPRSGAIGPFLLCIPRHSFHHTAYEQEEEEEEYDTHGQAYSGHPGSNW